VSEPKPKPFAIPKGMVWEAYLKVKANKGAAGVDGESIEEFERDLKGNLYKLWNRLSSGCYFPPPVRMVEIPKPEGRGVRVLGVPTVADRVAQTVVKLYLEPEVEPKFHEDSYGYRPGRSALDAVGKCRERCWKMDWVIDLDIKSFFRQLAVGPHSEGGSPSHQGTVDSAVRAAVAGSPDATGRRHSGDTREWKSARLSNDSPHAIDNFEFEAQLPYRRGERLRHKE